MSDNGRNMWAVPSCLLFMHGQAQFEFPALSDDIFRKPHRICLQHLNYCEYDMKGLIIIAKLMLKFEDEQRRQYHTVATGGTTGKNGQRWK